MEFHSVISFARWLSSREWVAKRTRTKKYSLLLVQEWEIIVTMRPNMSTEAREVKELRCLGMN